MNYFLIVATLISLTTLCPKDAVKKVKMNLQMVSIISNANWITVMPMMTCVAPCKKATFAPGNKPWLIVTWINHGLMGEITAKKMARKMDQ